MNSRVSLVLVLCVPPALAQYGITTRVSVSVGAIETNKDSGWPSLSDNGRYVAFDSRASQLVSGDLNGYSDIFVRDRWTGVTKRVSVGLGGVESNGHSVTASISGDGSRVAFASNASNLVSGDLNAVTDVFVVDVATLAAQLASVDAVGVPGNGISIFPQISGDGRFVAFESWAGNFSVNDLNFQCDVYRFDTSTGVIDLVSQTPAGLAAAGDSGGDNHTGPSISRDGRYVAFWSAASDVVPNDTNGTGGPPPLCLDCGHDVFVRDVQSATTVRVSVDRNGVEGNDSSDYPSISDDGRFIAFLSGADNFVAGDTNYDDVFVHDRDTDGDGVYDEPGAIDTWRVSVTSSGAQTGGASAGNFVWGGPQISGDGSRVAFMSAANDMTSLAPNGRYNVYVHDIAQQTTECATVTPAGALAPYHSYQPAIDRKGRHVAFATQAPSFVGNDGNNFVDVFVRTLCDPPRTYCTATSNSLGCTAAIMYSGVPSASLPSSFTISTSNLRNQVSGLLMYSLSGPAAAPFQGGILCLQQPTIRTPAQSTNGSASGSDCSGSLSFDFAAHVASGVNPALVDGTGVFAQFWSRDGGAPFGTNLTDALAFTLAAP